MSDNNKRTYSVKTVSVDKGTPLTKAVSSTDVKDSKEAEMSGIDGVLKRPYDVSGLQTLVEESSILQQCIDAYKRNIVGFGATPAYIEDEVTGDETPEMQQEWRKVQHFLDFFNYDESFEDVIAKAIGDREETGNGYIEIIRDGSGLPAEGHRLDPVHIWTTRLGAYVDVTQTYNGETVNRQKRFRKYVQDVGTKKVFYKEFGDPRKMDKNTGEYKDNISIDQEANEILHLKIGSGTYGKPRWIGQLIHMAGARKAEELNFNYFTQGRHTPMAILLHNAELSPESEQELQEYAKSVEGTDNAHKFLIIEASGEETGMLDEDKKNAKVEVKSLADMLQEDALFLDYDEASRLKVQSSFRLPNIYLGRSDDYNRATADTARSVTEEQVFEPERNSLEFIFNRKFLPYYEVKHAKLQFNKPEISNIDELVKVIDVGGKIKALAPNDVRDVIGKALGKELDNLEGDIYDYPAGGPQAQQQLEGMENNDGQPDQGTNEANSVPNNSKKSPKVSDKETEQVEKAYRQDEMTLLMKDVKDVLSELSDHE